MSLFTLFWGLNFIIIRNIYSGKVGNNGRGRESRDVQIAPELSARSLIGESKILIPDCEPCTCKSGKRICCCGNCFESLGDCKMYCGQTCQ